MESKQLVLSEKYTCVGTRGGSTVFALRGVGIKPLVLLYEKAPELLPGASVYDKVIGKAAATVAVLSGASYVWGQIMSKPAVEYLEAKGVPWGCDSRVDFISNRTQDGTCPLEAAVAGTDDPLEGYAALKNRISELMAGK